jgi:threonylcarbamoyladenosine tRNA methylthiotransferase MtaB
MKTVAFRTFGCRLNQYDSETIRTLLEDSGRFQTVREGERPEVFVVNTCTVTARADATARKAIRRIHSEHPDARIVVTGCYAQRSPLELAELPGVSLVVGAADRARVASKMDRMGPPGEVEVAVSPVTEARTFIDVPITEMMDHSRAFIKVQEGCNEACSFCIVPQTRGRSRSRGMDSVLSQARTLVQQGYLELVVTGVHAGDYGLDLPGARRQLAPLLAGLLEIDGLQRLRLSSIEPASVSDEIIDLMATQSRFARHFHIPFQSASDAVLGRMRRRYRYADFERLVHDINERVPGCGIGCDVICGFPGESDADFQATFDALERLPVSYVHPFSFSVRPGSEAEAFDDDVSPAEKKRRVGALKRLMAEKHRRFCAAHVGLEMQVLLEQGRRGGAPRIGGWTDNYLRVDLGEGECAAEMARVWITGTDRAGLVGERMQD